MILQQFFVPGIAHSSYLMGRGDVCAIIDPERHIQVYLEAARAQGMRITHILETHLHADFVSGHMDLAAATGAPIYIAESAECAFEHVAVNEGDTIELNGLEIDVLDTPGHTPEHVSYVVRDTARGSDPVAVFTGDTLFVGDVGRPDLFPGQAESLASALFDSLAKLMQLPDFCEVYPAHGAGSLCGRAMGDKRTSTIGYERRYNPALQIADRAGFIHSLTHDMPAAPDHFARCSDINRQGPTRIDDLDPLKPVAPRELAYWTMGESRLLLDVRDYAAFGGLHIHGAWHNDLRGNFATFAGWMLPPYSEMTLVASDEAEALEARRQMQRVGLDRATGYLQGGMRAWVQAGLPIENVQQVSVERLSGAKGGRKPLVLLDVRSEREYDKAHLDEAVNIPLPELRTAYVELPCDVPIVALCSTGNRSSFAASLLQAHGFEGVASLAGGMAAISAGGFGPSCPVCYTGPGPREAV